MDIDAFEALLRGLEKRRGPSDRARPDRALAARARSAERASLRLSRRCAARGAPHPGGDEPPLDRCGLRRRSRASSTREAIARVRDEAWPDAATPDELHDALLWLDVLDGGGARRQSRVAGAHATSSRHRAASVRHPRTRGRRAVGRGRAARAVRAARCPPRTEALGGDRARAARGLGPGHAREPSRDSLGLAPAPVRAALAALQARGLRDARPVHAGRRRGGVVRAAAARAHPSLHRQAAARRDRAGGGAGFPALSVRVAAGAAGCAHAGLGCGRGRARAARRLRGARRAPGRPTSCPRASPSTSPSGWTSIAARDASCGPGSRPRRLRPRARRGAGALDAHHAARAAQRQGLVRFHRGTRP